MPLVKVGKDLRQFGLHRILIQVHDTRKQAEHTGIDFLSCKRLYNQRGNKRPQKNATWIRADQERKPANS